MDALMNGPTTSPATPSTRQPFRTGVRRILAMLVLPILVMFGAVALGTSADALPGGVSCYGDYCSGMDPQETGCAADAYTVTSHSPSVGSGIAEVRWSPTCQTNWVRWTQYPTGVCLTCSIRGLAAVQETGYTQSIDLTEKVPKAGETVWTPMIYSPVLKVRGELGNYCGDSGLFKAAMDCLLNGKEATPWA